MFLISVKNAKKTLLLSLLVALFRRAFFSTFCSILAGCPPKKKKLRRNKQKKKFVKPVPRCKCYTIRARHEKIC